MSNILKASDGMVYTNGSTYGKTIYLGCTDKAQNWYEISEEEYNAILEEQQYDDTNAL